MGCYGLGTSRLMGSIVEVLHDEKGIIWPAAVAPYDVHLIALTKNPEMLVQAQELVSRLESQGIELLFDDRQVGAGEKFADADLIGIPVKILVGNRGLKNGTVEFETRKTSEKTVTHINNVVDTFSRISAKKI